MKAVIVGKLRINLDHLVWFTPTGTPGSDEEHEQPGLSLKTMDAESTLNVRYKSFMARDADLAMLDNIFAVERNAVIDQGDGTTPQNIKADTPASQSSAGGRKKTPTRKSKSPGAATKKPPEKTRTKATAKAGTKSAAQKRTATTTHPMIDTLMASDNNGNN